MIKKLISAALCSAVLLLAPLQLNAQAQPLPQDTTYTIGKLPNGLTYYIRHNAWPEKRAFFYIAQNVGSMQEEDSQRGLAHFLEHMCFNGTTHFPGDNLKQYLERIGVKFGENLNAYTAFDETVYNIDNVNVDIPGAIDSCLLILHDWSHDLLLEGKEIDKERGVINEEWRMRSTASMRMTNAALPNLLPGSKYAERMPIGTMDVVMNFPHDVLRAYYKKWYRPDLQAVVVVGDIDPKDIEQRITKLFADIKPAPADAAQLEFYAVPDNKEPLFSVEKDKEMQSTRVAMYWKTDCFPKELKGDAQYYFFNYMTSAMGSMFGSRIGEILMQENAPFLRAGFGYGNYFVARTKDAFQGSVICKDGSIEEGVKALYREILRARRHGFTASEYERFRSDFLSSNESTYLHRDKVKSSNYVQDCVSNFTENTPITSIEFDHDFWNQVVPQIPVDEINRFLATMNDTTNLVIDINGPDKEDVKYPSREEFLSWLAAVEAENIDPYTEEVNNEPLIPEMPAPGTVKSIKEGPFGSRIVTLSNGIKVYVKETDYSPNSISLSANSWGGSSLYPDSELNQTSNIGLVEVGGIGNYSAIDLGKRLAGIQASASASVNTRSEGIGGSCVKKDFETMLQLVYLKFTSPRKDETAFNSQIQRALQSIKNKNLDPNTALQDTIAHVVWLDNPRQKRATEEDIKAVNYDRLIELYRERFADAGDFDFFIIGDCNTDSIAPLLAKYIGALPTKGTKEKYRKIDLKMADGMVENVFVKEMETPSAQILFMYHAPVKYNQKNRLMTNILGQLLDILFTQTIREDEGGAYSIGCNAGMSDYPEPYANVQIYLPTAPDKRVRMTEKIYEGVEQMCNEGPKQEDLDKVREYMLRSNQESLKTNGYWLSAITNIVRNGEDVVKNYQKNMKSITTEDIRKLANKIFKSGNRITVGMTTPVKE